MCGIAGIMGSNRVDAIKKMTDIMIHRGPDDSGYYHDDDISLGQRRLSIIDINHGRQPISNEDDTLQLVCNGEIYNSPQLREALIDKGHRFKTATDVEVILHLYEEYGDDCVKHLRGMFAFALWDSVKRRLLMARDHLGQKPLFFCQKNGGFAFASEVKSILASEIIKPEIDLEGLWHYMSLRFMPDHHSLFKGIEKLPAAHYLVLEGNLITVNRYWDVDFKEKLTASKEAITDQLDELLLDTVKGHLLSDVRVGAFLSGGIDSGTVASMMAVLGEKNLPHFSIGTKEKEFDEALLARIKDGFSTVFKSNQKNVDDLINLLKTQQKSKAFSKSRQQIENIASNMLALLCLLKEKRLALRDLKPDNLFLDADPDAYPGFLKNKRAFSIGVIDVETAISLKPTRDGTIAQPLLGGTPLYATPLHLLRNRTISSNFGNLADALHLQDWFATLAIIFKAVAGTNLFPRAARSFPGILKILKSGRSKTRQPDAATG